MDLENAIEHDTLLHDANGEPFAWVCLNRCESIPSPGNPEITLSRLSLSAGVCSMPRSLFYLQFDHTGRGHLYFGEHFHDVDGWTNWSLLTKVIPAAISWGRQRLRAQSWGSKRLPAAPAPEMGAEILSELEVLREKVASLTRQLEREKAWREAISIQRDHLIDELANQASVGTRRQSAEGLSSEQIHDLARRVVEFAVASGFHDAKIHYRDHGRGDVYDTPDQAPLLPSGQTIPVHLEIDLDHAIVGTNQTR